MIEELDDPVSRRVLTIVDAAEESDIEVLFFLGNSRSGQNQEREYNTYPVRHVTAELAGTHHRTA